MLGWVNTLVGGEKLGVNGFRFEFVLCVSGWVKQLVGGVKLGVNGCGFEFVVCVRLDKPTGRRREARSEWLWV